MFVVTAALLAGGLFVAYGEFVERAALRDVELAVSDFGRALTKVPPPEERTGAVIREAYGTLVMRDLLQRWESEPVSAPGIQTAGVPIRIEVRSITASGTSRIVEGSVVYVQSVGGDEADAVFEHVVITLVREEGSWKVADFAVQKFPPGTLREATST